MLNSFFFQALLRCQNKDGAFLPSATICADKLDSKICENIFVGGASSGSSGTEPACAGGAVSAPCKCGSAPTPCQKGEDCDKSASKCNPGGGRKKRQTSGGDKRPEKCDLPGKLLPGQLWIIDVPTNQRPFRRTHRLGPSVRQDVQDLLRDCGARVRRQSG